MGSGMSPSEGQQKLDDMVVKAREARLTVWTCEEEGQ